MEMKPPTCVHPDGYFVYGIHKPAFDVRNLREQDFILNLGKTETGEPRMNQTNFPEGDVHESEAEWIYEIPNPFPFRGTTYIARPWAEAKAKTPASISLPPAPAMSFSDVLDQWLPAEKDDSGSRSKRFAELPEPVLLAIAATSNDSRDLTIMAENSCAFVFDPETGRPKGLCYETDKKGRLRPKIILHAVFEAVANNPFLPDDYKEAMVLRPGAQGDSEIVGDWSGENSRIFEYLRRNSYIPWGHYAANMAHDAVRYRMTDLTATDMTGLRHLYYQRTYIRLASELHIQIPEEQRPLTVPELEDLREKILETIHARKPGQPLQFNSELWGWNFGFDFAPTGYRLHASHQQVHQQFALIPETVADNRGASISSYACGDLIAEFIREYRDRTGRPFFDAYIQAIRENTRMDGVLDRPRSLIVHEDEHAMVFAPKAQTSQWELQLMTKGSAGNILEAGIEVRESLDRAVWIVMQVLTGLGARMITVIEFSKRFDSRDTDQRLLYSFLPRLPESPGAFSEAQLRWINGHFPEDFAEACRLKFREICASGRQ